VPRVDYEYIETAGDLEAFAVALAAQPNAPAAVDTETTGLDPLEEGARLLLLQIGLPAGSIYVINAAKLDLAPLRGVLDNGRLCVLQNAKFDYKWLKVKGGIRLRRVYDTMLAELILAAGLYGVKDRRGKVSLKALVQNYVGKQIEKETRKAFVGYQGDEFDRELLDYAAEDIPHLWTIKEAQTLALKQGGLVDTAMLEFRTVPVVGEMELAGITVDLDAYREVTAQARLEMAKAERVCRAMVTEAGGYTDLFGDSHLNLASPDQIKAAFRSHFGLEVKSTESKHLKRLDHPFALALLEFRDWETQVTSFGHDTMKSLVSPATGRLHAEFQQIGGDAGRFTCEKPNLQQIPADPKYRRLFVPRPGNVFVDADWQAMEMRILAKVSGDQKLLEAFVTGRDLHSHTAATMYGLDYDQVVADHKDEDKGSPERKRAKVLNFALCYGMGIPSLAEELKISKEEAEEAMDRYFGAFPGVAAFLQRQDRQGPRTLEVRSPGGRRRIFNPPKDKREVGAIQRRCRNSPMQMGNADAMKRAMILLSERLEDAAIHPGIILTVHDEILVECPKDRAEETAGIVRDSMNEAASFYLAPVPAVTEVKVAEYWSK
jgi:DNA polymerase I-like protein with 3'-5' exonuclease and polymerase domains